jgi:hypothetical protein
MNLIFSEYGDCGTKHHAKHPIPEDLFQLDAEIIPYIDKFPL